jgi:CRISPR-associated protein Csd1
LRTHSRRRVERHHGLGGIRRRPIHWFIDLDGDGRVWNFSPTTVSAFTKSGERKDTRGKKFTVAANYHMQWKNQKVQGVCLNDSNWLPDFLSGPANEIFPAGVTGDRVHGLRDVIKARKQGGKKFPDRNRLSKLSLWRRLVFKAERENPDNAIIKAIATYIRNPNRPQFSDLPVAFAGDAGQRLLEDLDGGKETLSFRVNGRIAVADPELRRWWTEQVQKQRVEVMEQLPVGADAYQSGEGPVTQYFPTVFSSIPFASFNAAPFTSYGLGSQTATMRLETAEKTSAGLNWLLSRDDTRLNLADETAVFWAMPEDQIMGKARASAVPFVRLLEKADTLAVRDFLRGIWGGRPLQIEAGRFYAATLLPGQGRFSVRSWHTDTLPRAQENLKKWFTALSLDSQEEGTPTLNQLAEATISKAKRQKSKPAPATYSALFESALFSQPLPHQIFAAAISRQEVEMAGQDHNAKPFGERLRARTSLIQLYFTLNKGITMNQTYDKTAVRPEHRTAFLCGRLLSVLDPIHNEAHEGKSASSPATRLYGAASKTPALAFPQLCQLVRHHLDKLPKYKRDRFQDGVPAAKREDGVNEDFEGLSDVVSQLKGAAGGAFPRLLSLEEQGVFAIGFYHQRKRCVNWPHFKKSEKTNKQPETSTPTV